MQSLVSQPFTPLFLRISTPNIVGRPLKIVYTFTKEDFKTLMLPVSVFSLLAAPQTSVADFAAAISWTWIHLLQFCISNQLVDPAEDAVNKPWRPIPAHMIDVETARALRWFLLPVCILTSFLAGVPFTGTALSAIFIANNELGFDSHWFLRSLCNALGYGLFNICAASITSSLPDSSLDERTAFSFACNAFIILTTIQAADFRDVDGDKLAGRCTFPIAYPEASRIAVSACILGWAVVVACLCGLGLVASTLCMGLAALLAVRFYFCRSVTQDRTSYALYHVWISIIQVVHLPRVAHTLVA